MSPWPRSATYKPCPMVLVPDSTVHCSRPPARNLHLSSTDHALGPWVGFMYIYYHAMLLTCDFCRLIPGTYVHNTYSTLKPRLVAYPTLKPRLVEHTHTDGFFFWDVSIRNSLRSNNHINAQILIKYSDRVVRGELYIWNFNPLTKSSCNIPDTW